MMSAISIHFYEIGSLLLKLMVTIFHQNTNIVWNILFLIKRKLFDILNGRVAVFFDKQQQIC